MIHVLQGLGGAEPYAWFAFDGPDLLRKVAADDALAAWEIWDCCSPRELLSMFDEVPLAPGVALRYPGICALGREHGWDTPLYRADHLLGRGVFRREAISLEQACLAALRVRGGCRVWPDDAQAVLALEADTDPIWCGMSGWRARIALREQLLATDALAEG